MNSAQSRATGRLDETHLDGAVVVAGAGAAGLAAAISAARTGAKVVLIDVNDGPGGTVGFALIHTLGGIYDSHQQPLNEGLPVELTERLKRASSLTVGRMIGKVWTLATSPDVYRNVVAEWIAEETNIAEQYGARIVEVDMTGDTIHRLVLSGANGSQILTPRAVIDTTGSGEVIRLIDPDLMYDDEDRAAGGLVVRLRGVQPGSLKFPKGIRVVRALREAAGGGELSRLCANAWIDSGNYEDEAYIKLFVPLLGDWRARHERGEVMDEACRVRDQVVKFLDRFPSFASARIVQTGALGIRDGGRIRGEYYLTESDVKAGRDFADGVCRCCWPIEYWHPERGLEMEYLDKDVTYQIPLRALKLAGVANLWAAGKCLSADHRAQASARVVGSCWSMGSAVGAAAANV